MVSGGLVRIGVDGAIASVGGGQKALAA